MEFLPPFLVVTGGNDTTTGTAVDSTMRFNMETYDRQWSNSPSMASARVLHQFQKISATEGLAIGGMDDTEACVLSIEKYDVDADNWSPYSASLTVGRRALCTAKWGSKVFIMGGHE